MVAEIEPIWGPIVPYINWYSVLLVLNAIIGLIAFEWGWRKTRRFRNPIEELNAQFPELCREDARHWKKWKLYPGALTLLVPRLIWILSIALIMVILLNVILIGHKDSTPITGCRRFFLRIVMTLGTNLVSMFGWFTFNSYDNMTREQVNNYEEYLGSVEDQEHA